MFKGFTESYTGADATGEIFFMLIVAFVLGWLARWVYERKFFEDDFVHEESAHIKEVVQEVEVPQAATAVVAPVAQTVQQAVAQKPVYVGYAQDDLKIVEGVGPKIESLLKEGGFDTWQRLAEAEVDDVKTLLRAAGERYRIHDPSTWPEQAQLAHEGKWGELTEFQDALSGGKDLTKIYK